MNLELLIEEFKLVTDTKEGLEQLRKLILNLAVRGILVEQNPEDEAALGLLKKIKSERIKLYEEGKIRKPKKLSTISEGETPFNIPSNWVWERLGRILEIGSSSRVHKRDWKKKGIPFLRAREIVKLSENGYVDNELFISEDLFQSLTENGTVPEANDIMITGVGTIGVPYIVKPEDIFYFKDASVLIFKNFSNLYPWYLFYLFKSPYWIDTIHQGSMGTTVHTFTITRANKVPIPFPPLKEQRRIVQKIGILLGQVDELKKKVEQDQALEERLQVAVLDDLQRTETPQASRYSWKRLTDHFEQIYRKPEHIDQLKQAILNAAVRGRLVPQDPNDEPAGKQMERLQEEKQRLYEEGKIRKPKELPPIKDEEIPYELPDGWVWEHLGNLGFFTGGGTPKKSVKNYWGGDITWVSPKDMKEKIITESELRITKEGIDNSSAKLIPPKSILIVARSGILQRILPVSINRDECTVNQDIKVIIPYLKDCSFYIQLMLKGFEDHILKNLVKQGMTVQSLKYKEFENALFPIPPLAEQRRILEKVDELFSWCGKLKEKLNRAQQANQRLLKALVSGALEDDKESKESEETVIYHMPDKRVREKNLAKVSGMSTTDVQAGIMAQTINGYDRYKGEKKHLGRTKMEKVCHIIESHAGIDLGRKPKRMQHGSADYPRLRNKVEPRAKKLGWFYFEEDENGVVHYKKGSRFHEPFQKLGYKLLDKSDEIDRIIKLFVPLSTRGAEVRQTVYAAWHDLVAYGKDPSDDDIVLFASTEKYWAKEKEKIPKEDFYEAINWLRENDLVPDGKGKLTIKE